MKIQQENIRENSRIRKIGEHFLSCDVNKIILTCLVQSFSILHDLNVSTYSLIDSNHTVTTLNDSRVEL